MKPHILAIARLLAILVVAGVCFFRLGSGLLSQTDEGFTANRAQSILLHHSALLTYDDPDEPQFQKPPLVYELIALAYRTIGINLWAVRLPGAILSLLVCLLLYRITREYFGEWVALASTALFCLVPFVALHIRTAMLEMPLLFMTILAVWAFAFAPRSIWMALVAGLAVAGAVMTKGGAGLLAMPVAVIMGLVRRPDRRRALIHAMALILAASVPVLIYDALLPEPWRHSFVEQMFSNQHVNAAGSVELWGRWPLFYEPLLRHLGWHLPLAVAGLVWLAVRARRQPVLLEWLLLFGLIAVPTVIGGLKMAHPFDRYFLPIYPFLCTLSVWLLKEGVEDRRAAWALIPAAVAAPMIEHSWPGWIPAAAFAAVQLTHFPRIRERLPGPAVLAALLLLATVTPGLFCESAWSSWQLPRRLQPQPEIARLASRARDLIPSGDPLVVGQGFKTHSATFYSHHEALSCVDWLLHHFKPGESRIALLRDGDLSGLPALEVETLARDGNWELARVSIAPDATVQGVHSLALSSRLTRKVIMRETFRLLNVQAREIPTGFVVTRVPSHPVALLPDSSVHRFPARADGTGEQAGPQGGALIELCAGEALELRFDQTIRCSGVDVDLADKKDLLIGITLQAFDEQKQEWFDVRSVSGPYHDRVTVRDGVLCPEDEHRLRMRFDPLSVARLRLINLSPESHRMGSVHVYTSASAQTP